MTHSDTGAYLLIRFLGTVTCSRTSDVHLTRGRDRGSNALMRHEELHGAR